MRKTVSLFAILLASLLAACSELTLSGSSQGGVLERVQHHQTEEQWIVGEVVGALLGLTAADGNPGTVSVKADGPVQDTGNAYVVQWGDTRVRVHASDHIWAPESYRDAIAQMNKPTRLGAPGDLAVREALTSLTAATLVDQSRRVSSLLQASSSASVHESAALLLGAFALRESARMLTDVRPALSRMTAHLALAEARRATNEAGRDGLVARALLLTLVDRQRDAMAAIEQFERGAASDADRAWASALRLRNTGDWRKTRSKAAETMLEQLEHARALRDRLGFDALLDYLDTLPEERQYDTGFVRVATNGPFTVETGNRFTSTNIALELQDAMFIWQRFHTGAPDASAVLEALNAYETSAQATAAGDEVLPWSLWAAHQQRHLLHAGIATWYHAANFGDRQELVSELARQMGTLTLYPVLQRVTADSAASFTQALASGRRLIDARPETVTQAAWSLFLERPDFVQQVPPFPLDAEWFTPAVPSGTAFELSSRSLRPGCPRPPTQAQAARWAFQMPYDHWTVWANEWYSNTSGSTSPSVAVITRAMKELLEYDTLAVLKMLEHMPISDAERLTYSKTLCEMKPAECVRLGELHLRENRLSDAVAAYDHWAAAARDRVLVSNGVLWLMRYHHATGNDARAEAIANMAGRVGSARGMDTRGEWLDRVGRHDEADAVYRAISKRYPDATDLQGIFLLRTSLRTGEARLRTRAAELLRGAYPRGPEALVLHALDATPIDGVAFTTFGARPAAAGLQPDDVIVGIDQWRVRSWWQYAIATRLSFDPTITFTVWRKGRYEQIRGPVPERWLGVRFRDHRGHATPAP